MRDKNDWLNKICFVCGATNIGGIVTNGDDGDGQYVGVDYGIQHFYCINCWNKGLIPDYKDKVDKAFKERNWCGYNQPYIGRCKKTRPCREHGELKCWKCGNPAIKGCSEASMLVCGTPECAEHPHTERHHQRSSEVK